MRADFFQGFDGKVGVVLDPRPHLQIQRLSQLNILDVVFFHLLPCRRLASHAILPQLKAFMFQLLPDTKTLTKIIQLAGWEVETLTSDIKIKFVIRRRRLDLVSKHLRVQNTAIESDTVESYQRIAFVKQVMDTFQHVLGARPLDGVEQNLVRSKPLGGVAHHIGWFDDVVCGDIPLSQ